MLNKINKELLPMKGHFFLWNAGLGPVVPFLSTYARQLGFSSVIVGIIYTVLPICGMIAKPLMGAVADRFRCQKKIFLFAQLLTVVAFISILYSPEVPTDSTVHFSCDYNEAVFNTVNTSVSSSLFTQIQTEGKIVNCKLTCLSSPRFWKILCEDNNDTRNCDNTSDATKNLDIEVYTPMSLAIENSKMAIFRIHNISVNHGPYFIPKCASLVSSTCKTMCDDYSVNHLLSKSQVNDGDVYGLYQFWVFLILMVIGWVAQAIVVSVGDAICFEMLGDKPNRYGYQRLFGALGWGLLSIIAGFLIDAMSNDSSVKNYVGAFYLAVGFLILDFIVSCRLQYTQKKISASILRDVSRLLVDIRIFVYLLWCVAVGICTGLIWNFLFWLIEDLAKAQDMEERTKTLEGLVMAIQCLCGELPFFFLSGWILKRIGHVHAMSLVLLAIGVRYILYSVIENPWWFLPVELSNGLTFGLFYACMASYASIVAPPGTEATMQGMVGAVFEGIGVSLGSFVGGILYQKYGGEKTFRIFGIGTLIACLVHAAVQYILSKKGKTKDSGGLKG